MDMKENKAYYKGYIDGYMAGVKDSENGNAKIYGKDEIETLPIGIMAISTRGLNCLTREGCVSVADVAALNADRIQSMRNMGEKTAAEIAHWLDDHGIHYSTWSQYL